MWQRTECTGGHKP